MIARIPDARRLLVVGGATTLVLGGTTLLVYALEEGVGISDASAVYLLAVVLVGTAFGTLPAACAAVAAFLLYNALFVQPLLTFTVADPREWLDLIMLLVIGTVVGRLAGAQRDRARAAVMREREALVLFRVSSALSNREGTEDALRKISDLLRREAGMERVWIAEPADSAVERIVADSGGVTRPPRGPTYHLLKRPPGEQPAHWIRIHQATRSQLGKATGDVYTVDIEAGGRRLGNLRVLRSRSLGEPSAAQTRMLAGAADQIGQAMEQDRLRVEATSAELARQSDALKSALLDSVSHDLRTPLAAIRAAASGLIDPFMEWSTDSVRQRAGSIDLEAERLSGIVANLLDLSRIEAGGLLPRTELYPISELVDATIRRVASRLGPGRLDVRISPDLRPVLVDATFIDQILTNLLDNIVVHVPADAPVRIAATLSDDELAVSLTVEDGGSGVPAEAMPHLFEKFYRAPRHGESSRRGTGVGLAVVRGLAQAMGGAVAARPSDLGGLAVDITLPAAAMPPEEGGVREALAANTA